MQPPPSEKPGSLANETTVETSDSRLPRSDTGVSRSDTMPSDPPPAGTARPRLEAGARVGGRYRIERFLGAGGFGDVYLACDDALEGQRVALKFVRHSGESAPASLKREVLLAQKVTHRNVCRIYDLEAIDGAWVVKMEHVAGETLADRLDRMSRLSLDEALHIARGVAAGLASAHAAGIVHRDLKPQNVMIDGERVVLMDFGVAWTNQDDAGRLVGTPEYMAPEQVRGQELDGRADQYALGCLLHRMLVGQPPFRAASRMEVLDQQLHAPAPDTRRERPDLPPWLGALILRLLEKDRAQRFADVTALVDALAGPPRRSRAMLTLSLLLVLLVAGGAFVVSRLLHAPPPWRPALSQQSVVSEEDADGASISPDGKQIAYGALRNGQWRIYVGSFGGDDARPVSPPNQRSLYASFSRDGRRVYYTVSPQEDGARARVMEVDVASGTTRVLAEDAYAATDCGNRLLLVATDREHCPTCMRMVLRGDDGDREIARGGADNLLVHPRCDQAGTRVVYTITAVRGGPLPPCDLWLASLDGGAPRPLTSDGRNNDFANFTADGKSVVFSSRRAGELDIWELRLDGGALEQLTFGGSDIAPAITPDGRQLLFNSDTTSEAIVTYQIADGTRRQLTSGRPEIFDFALRADGRVVACAVEGSHWTLGLVAEDGAFQRLFPGGLPRFSPDGQRLAFVREREVVLARPDGSDAHVLGSLPHAAVRFEFGGDGALHASARDDDGVLRAWRIPLDGPPALEAPPPVIFVLPSPARDRRLVELGTAERPRVLLLPAGAAWPPATPRAPDGHEIDLLRARWTDDGRALLGHRGQLFLRHDVADGREAVLLTRWARAMALSADGRVVFAAERVGSVRRQLVTNFGDRPRR